MQIYSQIRSLLPRVAEWPEKDEVLAVSSHSLSPFPVSNFRAKFPPPRTSPAIIGSRHFSAGFAMESSD